MYTPYIPKVVPPIMKRSRYHLIAFINSGSVKSRADMAVMASIIIMIGDTIPALTAASPKMRAPTMEMADPPIFGILRSPSLNISNDSSIINASKNAGNGTVLLWDAKFISSSSGSISPLNVVMAIYAPGVIIVIKNAVYLNILVNVLFMYLESLSSSDIKKSLNDIGIIKAKGELSMIITVLPFSRASHTLSGLSVDIIVGKILLYSF